VPEPEEVSPTQRFREDVGGVVQGADTLHKQLTISDEFTDEVIPDTDMFDTRMPNMVFSEQCRGIVVT
jgi:hypothetical protein